MTNVGPSINIHWMSEKMFCAYSISNNNTIDNRMATLWSSYSALDPVVNISPELYYFISATTLWSRYCCPSLQMRKLRFEWSSECLTPKPVGGSNSSLYCFSLEPPSGSEFWWIWWKMVGLFEHQLWLYWWLGSLAYKIFSVMWWFLWLWFQTGLSSDCPLPVTGHAMWGKLPDFPGPPFLHLGRECCRRVHPDSTQHAALGTS